MKISNVIPSVAAGMLALGMSASVASAQTCVVALPFDFNSAAVSATNRNLIDVIRTRYPNATVNLAGYADAVGSNAANLAISQRRAQTVANALTSGTSITVVNATGFGSSNLVVQDSGANQLNRRVEVTLEPCNPADFGRVQTASAASVGMLGNAGVAAAVAGAVLIVGALGSSGTTTTTTTTTGMGSGTGTP